MEQNRININPDKVFTKNEYSKVYDISRPTIDKYIKEKKIKSLKIKGGTLILAD
jgi:predicted DNA-binding transcriptional regulator AlpA